MLALDLPSGVAALPHPFLPSHTLDADTEKDFSESYSNCVWTYIFLCSVDLQKIFLYEGNGLSFQEKKMRATKSYHKGMAWVKVGYWLRLVNVK